MAAGTILVVNRVGFVGGAERVLLTAGAIARQHGWRVVLACPQGALADQAAAHGIQVETADIGRTNATLSPALLLKHSQQLRSGRTAIGALVQRLRPDVVHVHHPVSALYVRTAAKAARVPILLHVHETLPVSLPYAMLARLVYPACTHFIGVSEKSCEMVRAFRVPKERVSLIYNSVQPRFLQEVEGTTDLQQGGPHIGIFGAIEPRKGQEYLIQAAPKILQQHPNARFWIVGAVNFADRSAYLDRLKQLASSLSIEPHVAFTGFRDDVPALMASMDAVVLASTGFESLPTVLIEACALGRPVVATSVGGVSEIVRNGETGFIVPSRNADVLADALLMALSDTGRAMAAKAKLDIRNRFGVDRFEAELMACYRAVAGQNRAGSARTLADALTG